MPARLRVVAALALLTFPATLCAADIAPAPTAKIDPADVIAALIDRHLAADWAARGIKPAAPADDAEFVRRVYLDLIGRAPEGRRDPRLRRRPGAGQAAACSSRSC